MSEGKLAQYLEGLESDSSCVMYDKYKNWDALLYTLFLNGPLQSVIYSEALHGDKDTWIIAMMQFAPEIQPANTVPGYLLIDKSGAGKAGKLWGQLQFLTEDHHKQDDQKLTEKEDTSSSQVERDNIEPKPLYYNNQGFDFRTWDEYRDRCYVETVNKIDNIFAPRLYYQYDCTQFSVQSLQKVQTDSGMGKAFDGVLNALKTIDIDDCVCRDSNSLFIFQMYGCLLDIFF